MTAGWLGDNHYKRCKASVGLVEVSSYGFVIPKYTVGDQVEAGCRLFSRLANKWLYSILEVRSLCFFTVL